MVDRSSLVTRQTREPPSLPPRRQLSLPVRTSAACRTSSRSKARHYVTSYGSAAESVFRGSLGAAVDPGGSVSRRAGLSPQGVSSVSIGVECGLAGLDAKVPGRREKAGVVL